MKKWKYVVLSTALAVSSIAAVVSMLVAPHSLITHWVYIGMSAVGAVSAIASVNLLAGLGRKQAFALTSLQETLLERNLVVLKGNVNEEMAGYVRDCLLQLAARDNPPITVHITSGGGSVSVGLIIHDLLRLYPGKKTGVVIGRAESMAAIILQVCDLRQCTRNSFVLVHNMRTNNVEMDDLVDERKLKELKHEVITDQNKLYCILEGRTKKTRQVIAAACKEDCEMSAEEALDFGLIDEII